MSSPLQDTDTTPLRLMPREMRMMSERIFSLAQMPRGFALTLSDVPMYSQYLGLGGFALLRDDHNAFMAADPTALAVTDDSATSVTLDLKGQPAWVGLHAILDLAAELAAALGAQAQAKITVLNARHPQELAIAAALAGRIGLQLDYSPHGDGAVFSAQPAPVQDPIMAILNHEGTPLAPALWWEIYETARSALAPDTAVSRRHAGVQIVNPDGSVIGRGDNDDDADVDFLARGARESA